MSTARLGQVSAIRQRLRPLRPRPMARRPGDEGRISLSPRAMRIAGWLAAVVLLLGIAGVVRLLGSDGGVGAPGTDGSPSPGSSLLPIAFGTALDADRQVAADTETDRFARGDTFAYSVAGTAPVTAIYVEVRRTFDGPIEQVQAPIDRQVLPDGPSLIGFTVPAAALLDAWGPGTYLMRIHLEATADPIAAGTFRLVEPLPSAAPSSP